MYYHVTTASYAIGDDLLCWDELEARGDAPTWKFGGDEPCDTDVVCLFETIEEARAFVAEWLPDGVILAVDLTDADDVRMTRVDEGFPAVLRRIPAKYVTVVG